LLRYLEETTLAVILRVRYEVSGFRKHWN